MKLPETQDSKASDHGNTSKATLAPRVHFTETGENVVHIGSSLTELVQSVCVDVQAIKSRLADAQVGATGGKMIIQKF